MEYSLWRSWFNGFKIIYIELTKLSEVENKPVTKMTGIEKWALFIKYANQKRKQSLIQEIIKSEERIRMGAEVLETISKDILKSDEICRI